ncbi:class I SAM-dependent methyltransferase [Mesorhizobium sp. LHD-90]|uniref:class I SAM-dependent methyltransferase n=1 Tax=Mesorhizobium sp. LHD-90 TaxID=3071414 RepID=UPI0027E18ED1|nr:class I SAM-dependent methyltransferase [Mesorhizobium sp. LHD-90]MDQ6435163.1 class I SAM-dependent methyltransferase [Mesorhizobium sp. LHD-90]
MNESKAATKIRQFDADFDRWVARNPGGKFSAFSAIETSKRLKNGASHATLGTKLKNGNNWAIDGLANCQLVYDLGGVNPETKICDYGCGNLRVGVHVIDRQAPGSYFGIDVSEYLIAEGIRLVGDDVIRRKRPVLGTIKERLDDVVEAAVDITFSFNVSSHIHPDEQDAYVGNLKAICHKPGARLLLNVVTFQEPVRFQPSGWAWTIPHYVDWFAPMKLIDTVFYGSSDRAGMVIEGHRLTFQR